MNHWAQPLLHAPITSVKSLSGGCQHQTDYVSLADQSQWVCKKMRRENWLGVITLSKLTFMKKLDTYLYYQNFQTIQCYQTFRLRDHHYGIILAYQEGRFLPSLTPNQSNLLGKKLAELHGLSRGLEGAKQFPKIQLPLIVEIPDWVNAWALASNRQINCNQKEWVMGHRDLNLTNIIWNDKKMPVFIDWESAGWIHANVDLVGLAINCAFTEKGIFSKENFQEVLRGYKTIKGQLPPENDNLWILIGHSWLLWYQFTLTQNWGEQAKQSLEILGRLFLMRESFRELYLEII